MNVLFCGDIVGKSGRASIVKYLPSLKEKLKLDLVIANAENSAHGFGLTPKTYNELSSAGIDFFTLGNHFLDQVSISDILEQKSNIIRPYNYKDIYPGRGYNTIKINGLVVLIINITGQLFMKDNTNSPFKAIDEILDKFQLKKNADIIIVDFHAEATSEKNALALYLNGRVSAVLGTHTHIPTQDCRILSMGTFFQTDVGMCGDYNSVVGMSYEGSIERFCNSSEVKNKLARLEPAMSSSALCGSYIKVSDTTGLALQGKSIILGDVLLNTI